MNSLTDQASQVLAEIAAELAICDKATVGKWQHDESEMPAGKVKHVEGYLVATCQMRPDAAFIASARTVCPKALRMLKTAIEGCLDKKSWDASIHQMYIRQDAEEILTTLINQWNSK